MQLPRRFAEDFRGQSLLWLDLDSYLAVVQLGLGARQHMYLPLSFRPRRRSTIPQASPLSLRLELGGYPTMPTQKLERHHRRLGVTRPVAGRRPRGRMGWMEILCICKAGWCAGIPLSLTDARRTCVEDLEKVEWSRLGIGVRRLCGSRFLPNSELAHSFSRVWRSQPWGGGGYQGLCVTKACRSNFEPPTLLLQYLGHLSRIRQTTTSP